jgi:hypothetical protein
MKPCDISKLAVATPREDTIEAALNAFEKAGLRGRAGAFESGTTRRRVSPDLARTHPMMWPEACGYLRTQRPRPLA